MKIAWLDFVYDENSLFTKFVDELKQHAAEEHTIDYHYVTGVNNLEYMAYEILIMPKILDKIRELKELRYDAVMVGCFYNPAVDAAKELFEDIIITGAGEAAILTACKLGKRFSIIAARKKHFPRMREEVEKVGVMKRLASLRSLEIRVTDLQADHDQLKRRMSEEIEGALCEDGAEVIVLGCTAETGQYRALQEAFQAPVIDPVIAALRHVEMEYACKKYSGWTYSRRCTYEMPPRDEVRKFFHW